MTATEQASELAFAQALSEFQANMPKVGKASKAEVPTKQGGKYSYTYAALPDILDAALPQLTKVGLSFTAAPTLTDHGFVLRYSLLHVAGHRETGEYPLPDPASSSPQQIGSAVTYGRRYCFCALTGIAAEEDDDGQAASEARSERLPSAPRTRGATSRKGPEQTNQPDEWSTPAPEAKTDQQWIADFRARLVRAANLTELQALDVEAHRAFADAKLTVDDARDLKAEIGIREAELKP